MLLWQSHNLPLISIRKDVGKSDKISSPNRSDTIGSSLQLNAPLQGVHRVSAVVVLHEGLGDPAPVVAPEVEAHPCPSPIVDLIIIAFSSPPIR